MDLEYARRLNEMLAAQQIAQRQRTQEVQQHLTQQHLQQQQQQQQRRRQLLDLDSIPILQLSGCATPKQQQQQMQQPQHVEDQPDLPATKPSVDWRQVVEHVRRTGQTVTGQQMLTDKFRCAGGCMEGLLGVNTRPPGTSVIDTRPVT